MILTGDMNHDHTSGMYAGLMGHPPASTSPAVAIGDPHAAPPLKDAFDYDAVKSQWTTYHGFTGQTAHGWPTDLIFYGGPLEIAVPAEIERDGADGRYPSDHFFVLADFNFSP